LGEARRRANWKLQRGARVRFDAIHKKTGLTMGLLKHLLLASTAGLLLVGGAQAADLPTKKAPPAPPPAPNCFASFWDYMNSSAADCPLTFQGITLYGTIDMGVGYESAGVPFNRQYPTGVEELISKNSRGPMWTLVPGGISQSNVGIKISEPIGSTGWNFVANAQLGFDPYTLQLANGPGAMTQNTTTPLQFQNGNGDSSRAGQWDNSLGYLGVSNKTFGTLTFGRVYSLTLDGVNAYDPMGGSYAFSPIGYSGKVAGAGSTEDTRPNTAFKYNVSFNNFRLGALAQVGGYEQGNGSNGEYEIGAGADLYGFSFDAIYTYIKDQVNLATWNGPVPALAPSDDLKATLSDNDSVMLLAKYTYGPVKIFGGYEWIKYMNPTDSYAGGFTSIGDYPVLGKGAVNSTAYTNNNNLQIFWTGAKYSILPNLDVTGAYYHYSQPNYALAGTNCGANAKIPAPGYNPQGAASGSCAGSLNAYSAMIDWKPLKRLDVYAGLMYSEVNGGLASGFLHSSNIDPTVGLRLQF
jgi:predicted porin